MKKNVLRIIIFLAPLLILLWLVDYTTIFFIDKIESQEPGKLNRIMNRSLDEEIMIFGSSVVWVQMDPEVIGEKLNMDAFNMGINGCNYSVYRAAIHQYLTYAEQCKYLIIGVSFHTFWKPTSIYNQEYYYTHLNNPFFYQSLTRINPDLWKIRYLPGYKLVWGSEEYYKNVMKGMMVLMGKDYDAKEKLGYVPIDGKWPEGLDEKYTIRQSIEFYEESFNDFAKTIDMIKAKGIEPVVVIPPLHELATQSFTDFDILRNRMKELSADKGFFFRDFTSLEMCKDKQYFYNSSHLNAYGAGIFSGKLADALREHFLQEQ